MRALFLSTVIGQIRPIHLLLREDSGIAFMLAIPTLVCRTLSNAIQLVDRLYRNLRLHAPWGSRAFLSGSSWGNIVLIFHKQPLYRGCDS